MKAFKFAVLIMSPLLALVFSCSKDGLKSFELTGYAQKGPFIVGSLVTISELDNELNQTGKVFTTTIIDDLGKFELQDIELSSGYVKITADGNYYNELLGSIVSDRLVLSAIADLNDTRSVNINVLTNLESERLKYLIKEENYSFSKAKEQCLKEILKIFSIDSVPATSSEDLDISGTGQENLELLAISSIIQTGRNVGEMIELMTRIQLDIKEDGILDSKTLLKDLFLSAFKTNAWPIAKNLYDRYSNLGIIIDYPDIQPIIDTILSASEFEKPWELEFPPSTQYGLNILTMGDTVMVDTSLSYCFAVNQKVSGDLGFILTSIMSFYEPHPGSGRYNMDITNYDWGGYQLIEFDTEQAWPLDFPLTDFTGSSVFQISFHNHGMFDVKLEQSAFYSSFSKRQFIFW
jgi:hypothetical protein